MTLITRLARLFRADFHAVLDEMEAPDVLLRQSIREMEDDLARQEQAIRLATHEETQCAARRGELDERLREIGDALDLCFASGKEDLARGLVRRKLETQRLAGHLAARGEALRQSLARRQEALAANRATLEGFRQKAELVSARAQAEHADEPDAGVWSDRGPLVREDEVEVAFLREQRARRGS